MNTHTRRLKSGKKVLVRDSRIKRPLLTRDQVNQLVGMAAGGLSVGVGMIYGSRGTIRQLYARTKKAQEQVDFLRTAFRNKGARASPANPTKPVDIPDFVNTQKMGDAAQGLKDVVDTTARRFSFYQSIQMRNKTKSANFSMSQVRSAYQRDRYNPEAMAYFAAMSDGDWVKAGVDGDRKAMTNKTSGLRNAIGNVGKEVGKKAVSAKNKTLVLVTRDGKQFMQARWKNVQDVAGKGAEMGKKAGAGVKNAAVGANNAVNNAWANSGTGGKVAMGSAALLSGAAAGLAAREALGWNKPGKDPFNQG